MPVVIQSFATAHNGGSNQTTLTIGKPAGTVAGDLLICFLFSRREAGTPNNHSTLSGWNLIQTAQSNPTSVLMVTSSFYKVATNSEPNDYTWVQSESQRFCGIIMRVSGLDTANPIDVFDAATYQATPGNNLIPAPSVTPTVTNGFLVCGVGFAWAGVTFTASPPGMTEVYNFNNEQNALNAAVAVEQLTTDDPTGRRDWTATDFWSIGQSVVFRQEAGGTVDTQAARVGIRSGITTVEAGAVIVSTQAARLGLTAGATSVEIDGLAISTDAARLGLRAAVTVVEAAEAIIQTEAARLGLRAGITTVQGGEVNIIGSLDCEVRSVGLSATTLTPLILECE
jgi:hypothetical protein